jgi:hypothetical protein
VEILRVNADSNNHPLIETTNSARLCT